MPSENRAAWVEINLAAAANNMRIIRSRVGPKPKIIAVVKADGYGHGAVRLSRVFLENGADMLAIAEPNELYALREAGISAEILLLGWVPESAFPGVLQHNGILSVFDLAQATQLDQAAEKTGLPARVHLKVDTGMHRLGLSLDDVDMACAIASLPHLRMEGVFSHFSDADGSCFAYSEFQMERFQAFVAACASRGLHFPMQHIANSATICRESDYFLDAVRPGIILYGYGPSEDTPFPLGVKPLMSVKARIARLHRVYPGEAVSYGCTWKAVRESVIATVPFGYADGIPRQLSNRGSVLIGGYRAPICGRVCMDQLMADVTEVVSREQQLSVGDEAVLMGCQGRASISATEIARLSGTIHYDILCKLGLRLEKIYC